MTELSSKKKVSFYTLVDPNLRKEFKKICVHKDISISAAMVAYLKCVINNPELIDRMLDKAIKL